MKFLNKKEQVIDLEITPYGKSLLARGKFRPAFYAFYDRDVVYDSEYGGVIEVQNSASVRINESPQLETQTYFYNLGDRVRESVIYGKLQGWPPLEPRDPLTGAPYVTPNEPTIGTFPDRSFDAYPIGRSSISKDKLPAWNIKVLKGEISSSFATGSSLYSDRTLNIPQINMDDIECTLKISDNIESDSFVQFFTDQPPYANKVLNFISDSIVLEIDEDNTDFELENFDVQVFEVTTETIGSKKKEYLRSLLFKQEPSLIKNNILLDPEEVEFQDLPTTPNYSEYYFNISIDEEISESELCKLNPEDRPLGIFSKRILDCEEILTDEIESIENLYNTEEFDGECE